MNRVAFCCAFSFFANTFSQKASFIRSIVVVLAVVFFQQICLAQTYSFGTLPTLLNTDFTRIKDLQDPKFINAWNTYELDDPHGESTIFTNRNIVFSEKDGIMLKVSPPTKQSGKTNQRFLYGRYEIVARVPGSDVPHASAWLLGGGPDVNINGYREVDIFEHASFVKGQEFVQVGAFIAPNKSSKATHILSRRASIAPAGNFHVFRCDWTPKTVRLCVDGVLAGEVSCAASVGGKTPLRNEMRLRLDIIGGVRPGAPFHALRIKSVKVYPLIFEN